MLTKYLDPKNDLAFKRIFGSEKNKEILIHFLNDIFARTTNPVEDVTFLKTALDPEVAAQRTSSVDILCEDAEGDRFIVEMQVSKEPGFEKRAQYYAAKTYIEQREKGVAYQDLKSVTFLAITDFTLFPDKPTYLSHHQILDLETLDRNLKDFSFSFLELPKFKKKKNQLTTMTEKWAYFFKDAPETKEADLAEIIGSDLIIARAYEELNRFSWSQEELRAYDSVDRKTESNKAVLKGAFEDGKAEGIAEGKIKIAQKLLSTGMLIEDVCEVTGLLRDEFVGRG